MSAFARIVALYCGQGMAHLVEIYKGGSVNPPADFLILIDFGGNKTMADDAVAYVVARLKEQHDAGRFPKLDLTVISHQDGDHVLLLKPLGDAIVNGGLSISFGNVFIGGLDWSKDNRELVKNFFLLSKTRPVYGFSEPFRSDYDGVKTRAKLGKLVELDGVFFRLLTSQLKVSGRQDIVRNASSAVVVIENGVQSVVLPGDSTYQTMAYINELYDGWGAKPLVPSVRGLEVPHHGALRTAVESYLAKGTTDDFDFSIVQSFANNLAPGCVFASAGLLNTHGHPVKELLDIFDGTLAAFGKHTYVAFEFDAKSVAKKQRYDEFESNKALFTTLTAYKGGEKWSNVVINMAATFTSMADFIDVSRSLREILADEARGARAPARKVLYAPAPEPEESGS